MRRERLHLPPQTGAALIVRRGQVLKVIDPQGEFYPPAALGWGIPAGRLLLVRPATPRDAPALCLGE